MSQILTIDSIDYDIEKMSETAKTQIVNIRATDQEIVRAKALLSMLETARSTYAKALQAELDKMTSENTDD